MIVKFESTTLKKIHQVFEKVLLRRSSDLSHLDLVVRLVMKDKGDSSFPGRLDGHVVDALLGGGVVPHRQVRVAIGIIWRWLDLETVT